MNYGGKATKLGILLPNMPPTPIYVEAFGGSGVVLINRPRVEREVYSDLNEGMVALMTKLRDDPERLIWRLRYSPYSRRTYYEARDRTRPTPTDVANRAADALVATEQGMNSGNKPGWKRHTNAMHPHSDDIPRFAIPNTVAKRQGIAEDTAIVHGQSMVAAGKSWTFGKTGIAPSGPKQMPAETNANRQGMAEDAHVVGEQAFAAGGGGWAHNRDTDKHHPMASAGRQGIAEDTHVAMEQSIMSANKSWAVHVENKTRATAISRRQGTEDNSAFAPMSETPLYQISERLQGVEIRHSDALEVIAEFASNPDVLFYLDPPYVHDTRKSSADYAHEMDNDAHAQMLELITGGDALVVLSGYAHPLYDDKLRDWKRVEHSVRSSAAMGKNGTNEGGRADRTEVLWANFDIELWKPQKPSFFDMMGPGF